MHKKVILMILDGWGKSLDPRVSAIDNAHIPFIKSLYEKYPSAQLRTDGLNVGLPEGQMGNSEVGHMNLGAGRIVYQDLTRVDAAIEDGSFFTNDELLAACAAARDGSGTLHVMGLLSPGGVHSHEAHIHAMLDLAKQQGVDKVRVHAFLDGRDTPPQSAEPSLEALEAKCAAPGTRSSKRAPTTTHPTRSPRSPTRTNAARPTNSSRPP